jgi:hypothetical protein
VERAGAVKYKPKGPDVMARQAEDIDVKPLRRRFVLHDDANVIDCFNVQLHLTDRSSRSPPTNRIHC